MKKKEVVKNETNIKNEVKETIMVQIPIMNLKQMSDEEWNRLAYKNMLKRNGVA